MPSQLYQNAHAALGAHEATWDALLEEMRKVVGPNPDNHSGNRTAALIQDEEQLSGEPLNHDPDHLVSFLKSLCSIACGTANAQAFQNAYEKACDDHVRHGPEIAPAHRPTAVYRCLRDGSSFLECLAKALGLSDASNKAKATVLNRKISKAKMEDAAVTWESVVELIRNAAYWDAIPSTLTLAGAKSCFVTFDGKIPLDRSSAKRVHAALALPFPWSSCFLEAKYAPAATLTLHIPTVADAGWFKFFKGTPAGEPHGWTNPHPTVPNLPPQPEAVQLSPTFGDIAAPGDLRIVPP